MFSHNIVDYFKTQFSYFIFYKLLMPFFFYEKPNNRRSPTIREMERKRNKNGKSKLVTSMGQHGRNSNQQAHWKNKRQR